ncbi:MAG: hypothetical protein ACRDYE_07175 [Acidimicrobiales bacterium]
MEGSDPECSDPEGSDREHRQDEVTAAVLEFVHDWPSQYPSPSRIAQAIGERPGDVIDALARIRAAGDYPAVDEVGSPEPAAPALDTWDRAN